MILAMLVGLALTAQAAPPIAAPDDIVVVGERLKRLKIVTKKDRATGGTRCFVKPASGVPGFDAGICTIYRACIPKVKTAPALEACMTPALTELAKSWADGGPGPGEQAR